VRAAAIVHGLMRGRIDPIAHHADGSQRIVAMVDRDCFTVAPFAGHFEPLVECGTAVRAGDALRVSVTPSSTVPLAARIGDLVAWAAVAAACGLLFATRSRTG
jgi:predicted deacylase